MIVSVGETEEIVVVADVARSGGGG